MGYLPYEQRRRIEQETWNKIVEQFNYTLDNTDLDRDPDGKGAAGKALNVMGVKPGAYRNKLFGRLLGEAGKHPRVKAYREKLAQRAQDLKDLEDARRQLAIKDAYAHQKRQPRDTWDPRSER